MTVDDHEPLAGCGAGSHDLRMEAPLARVVADLGDVKSDISEITGILARVAPRMYEIYGRFPHLGTLRGK
jgi:hypothetical protein